MAIYVTGDPAVDGFVSTDAFALVIAMVLDQQVPLERAFSAPAALRERLGVELDPAMVAAMVPDALREAFSARPALHRFPAAMAERCQRVAQVIVDRFGGDAAAIWTSAPDGATLLKSVRSLPGFGEQKARIFVALLAKQLGVRPPGWEAAAGPFGNAGSFVSVADIDSPDALERVREHKREMKVAAKSVAHLAPTPGRGAKKR